MERLFKVSLIMSLVDRLSGPVRAAANFEAAMSGLKAISGATGAQFEELRKQALDLGAATSFSAMQVAEAQTELARLGFTSEKIIGAMPGLLNLAAATQTSLAEASTVTANALNAFGMEASRSAYVADIIAESANRSASDMGGLAAALANAGASARAAGGDFAELAAMTGTLADVGISGNVAGTAIKNMYSHLQAPMSMARKAIAELGLVTSDSAGNMRPLFDIMKDLEAKTANMGGSQRADFIKRIFGEEAAGAVTAMLNKGTDHLEKFATGLRHAGGAAALVAETQLDNLQGSLTICASAFEGLQIAIGDIFTSGLRKVVDALSALFSWLTKVAQHPIGKVLIALAAAAASAVTALTLLAGAVAAANWAWPIFISNSAKVKALLLSLIPTAKASAASILIWNNTAKASMFSAFGGIKTVLLSPFSHLKAALNYTKAYTLSTAASVKAAFLSMAASAKTSFISMATSAKSGLSSLGGAIKTGVTHPIATAQAGLFALGRGAKATFLGLGSVLKGAFSIILNPLVLLAGLAALVYLAWNKNFGGIRDLVSGVWDKIEMVFTALSQGMESLKGASFDLDKALAQKLEAAGLMGLVITIMGVVARVKAFIGGFWSAIEEGWEGLKNALAPAIKAIGRIFETLGGLIMKVFGLFGSSDSKIKTGPWQTLGKIVGGVLIFGLELLAHILSLILTILSWIIDKVGLVIGAFIDFGGMIFGAIAGAWNLVVEFLSNINLFEIGKKILGGLIDGIKSMAGSLLDTIIGVFSGVEPVMPMSDAKIGPFSHLTASGRAIPETMAQGIKSGAGSLRQGMLNMAEGGLPGLAAPGLPGAWSYDFIQPPRPEQPENSRKTPDQNGNVYVENLHITMPEGTNAKNFVDELKGLVKARRISND
jgi:TP901 family phage tail tape measure protein